MIQTTAPALLAALNGASSKIGQHKSMAALNHVAIDSRAVAATDLDLEGVQRYAAQGPDDEVFYLDRAALKRILAKIGDSPIAIVATGDAGENALVSLPNGAAFTLAQLPAAEYPNALKAPGDAITLDVPAATLRNMLERALVAASKDDTRPVLTSLCLEQHEAGFALVSTDSYRLHILEHGDEGRGDGKRALLPRRFAEAVIERIKKLKPDTVTIAADTYPDTVDPHARVTVGDWTGSCRLVQGTFPNWRSLMPDATGDDRSSAILPAADMLAAIAMTEAVGARSNTPVRLTVGASSSLSIDNLGGAAFTAPLNILYDAGSDTGRHSPASKAAADAGMELGFNGAFLADMIAASQSDSPILGMISPLRPSWITSVGCAQCGTPIDGHGVSFRGLLMPIRLG